MNGKGLGERVGTTFSAEDLILAAVNDAKEIRAVTRGGYTFSIKRPKMDGGLVRKTSLQLEKSTKERNCKLF